ncbi:microsomal glutathione S-transferase 1-like [Adelges cooleyi]|uniref:microsomal glutathione S-transferase 1-like n=1 Tax=Adelges cooleyi TaxID=133065 RepID=UPI002180099D|nr:microsomal glutathione S-transferase 1-like [Adelges cooleyi]
MATETILSLANPVFSCYLFYVSLLTVKLMIMSLLTGFQRFKKQAVINPEDTFLGAEIKIDDDVERVRRAHLNDLENIPPFMVIALAYLFTNPSYKVASNLFRLFTASRFLHTLIYAVFVMPQPTRAILFWIGFVITWYMAIQGLLTFNF